MTIDIRSGSSEKKKALVTGITGQDGSYLAEFLLEKGYDVYGMVRRTSTQPYERIAHLVNDIELVQGDLLDQSSLTSLIRKIRPAEVYNLAAQSFVAVSWEQPVLTSESTGIGVARLLEAIRTVDTSIKFYQASSSEMYGKVREIPQREETPFHPRSPYGVAKAYAYYLTLNYRESYNMFAVNGVLFNHESPRRGIEFVTRKVTDAVARIKLGLSSELRLGNLDSKRDWGYAGDYVEAMWMMLQHPTPEDFVIATGETHSVEELVNVAFSHVGLKWQDYVVIDPKFVRPAEVDLLIGDASKAKAVLGWKPRTSFESMVRLMVDSDIEKVSRENYVALQVKGLKQAV